MSEDESLEEILEQYTSEEAVRSAQRQKEIHDEKVEYVGVITKGYPDVQWELDLHTMTVPEALLESERFIERAIANRIRTIRLITGRGLHSKNMVAVLPDAIEKRLSELRRSKKVLAFKRERSGGSFRVYLIS